MAGENSQQDQSGKMKYYRTRIAGLSVQVGDAPSDEDKEKGTVAPPVVRFEAFEERHQGDKVVFGYLATDNLVAIRKLAKDGNVEQISEKDYNDATDLEKGAKRAAVQSMLAPTALASVKTRLDILSSDTTWDAAINEFVLSAVKRLYPIAQLEIAPQTKTISVDSFGAATVDMTTFTTPILAARKVEVSGGQSWVETSDYYHQSTSLLLHDLSSSDTQIRVYGLGQMAIADVPTYLEQAVLWYAMSEFYDYLAGNKRKYNLYTQNGSRSVDNMQDESDKYEQKANVYLNDHVTLYGVA